MNMTQQHLQEQRSKHTLKRCGVTFAPRCQNGADSCTNRKCNGVNFTDSSFRKVAVFLRYIVRLFINVIVKKVDISNSKGKCDTLKSTPSLQALRVVLMDEIQP